MSLPAWYDDLSMSDFWDVLKAYGCGAVQFMKKREDLIDAQAKQPPFGPA